MFSPASFKGHFFMLSLKVDKWLLKYKIFILLLLLLLSSSPSLVSSPSSVSSLLIPRINEKSCYTPKYTMI